MPILHLKFGKYIYNHNDSDLSDVKGPLFTRWLPNGDADGLDLLDNETAAIRVWFRRLGQVCPHRQMIVFDVEKDEVPSDVMARQGILDAGPLCGRLTLKKVATDEIDAITGNKLDNPSYMGIGKRVVSLLMEYIGPFVSMLRITYGQYWLNDIEAFDSRKASLGHYCSSWSLMWSLDNTGWSEFRPNQNALFFKGYVSGEKTCAEFLTQEDWQQLKSTHSKDYNPPISAFLLNRSHRLLNDGQIKYALIESISSLEIAIELYIERSTSRPVNRILQAMLRCFRFQNTGRIAKHGTPTRPTAI
jgi:hypothetical protein